MTRDGKFKRRVRARMRATGENYIAALAVLRPPGVAQGREKEARMAAADRGTENTPADQWPSWCAQHPWLTAFLDVVEEEVRERGVPEITPPHLMLALTRSGSGSRALLDALRISPRRWRDELNIVIGLNEGILSITKNQPPFRRSGRSELYASEPLVMTPSALEILDVLGSEIERSGVPAGPGHVLAAIARSGWRLGGDDGPRTLAEVRAVAGLPHGRRILAPGVERRITRRPTGLAPLILSGGPEADSVCEYAIDQARRFRKLGRADVLVVGVFAARPRASKDQRTSALEPFARHGAKVLDARLDSRADAHSTEVIERLRKADIIYVGGGHAENLYEALLATPALDAMIDASDAGTVVMGSSAGSMIWGVGTLSAWESGSDAEPLPMFGWLPNVVVYPHYYSNGPASADRLREAIRSFPNSIGLGITSAGGVVAETETRWSTFRTIEEGFAHRPVVMTGPGVPPDPLPPLVSGSAIG